MPNDSQRPDVAVFIDFENVYVSVRDKLDANPNFEMIMDRCEDLGRVVIARAYADWYRYPRVTSALYANGIEPMYVPTYYYDRELGRTGRAIKNSVDMNLCIDAMKTLFTNTNIAKFVLATGDRDFIPLVNSIRQQGKEVIVIGIGGAASSHLAQSADEFIFYESLIGKKTVDLVSDQPRAKMPEKGREAEPIEEPERPREREPERPREREAPPAAPAQPDVYDTLVRAINLARERGYVCSFGSLKLLMKELMGGDFKEGRYKDAAGRPFAKFKDFVLEAERRGKVQVFTSGTVNEVFLPGEDPYKLSQFAQELKEEPAAPILASPVDGRADARAGVSTNGRRRRRRRGQRPGGRGEDSAPIEELGEEVEEVEEIDYISPDEILSPELLDEGVAADLDALPDLDERDESQAEAVFEELLEQIEEQDAESQALASLDPLDLLAPPALPDEPAEPEQLAPAEAVSVEGEPEQLAPAEAVSAESEGEPEQLTLAEAVIPEVVEPQSFTLAEVAGPEVLEPQPFTEGEWSLLREVVVRHERPISFAQIHDAMREARNNAGIVRTNEELRTLIKQAINSGMLERSGKGNRVTYRLAQPAEAVETPESAADLEGQVLAPPPADLEGQVLEPPPADLVGQVLELPPVEIAESIAQPATEEAAERTSTENQAQGDQPAFFTPEAAAQAELAQAPVETAPEAEPVTVIAADQPSAVVPTEQKPARSRRKRAAEPAPVAPAEVAAPPKRSRPRRKPAGGETSAEPVAEAPAAPEESTPAKPKRTRRKKTENTEA